jgi:NAD-dependent dihydropyrimidine dehydrogenase PreA subunit
MSISIDYDLCENSGACVAVCPEHVLEQENGHTVIVDSQACISCWICVDNCVSGAIEID